MKLYSVGFLLIGLLFLSGMLAGKTSCEDAEAEPVVIKERTA